MEFMGTAQLAGKTRTLPMLRSTIFPWLTLALAGSGWSGCISGESIEEFQSASTSSSSSSSTSIPSGARAAKIIFRQANPGGSFSAPAAGGTVPTPGSGHQAVRIFNADGTLLADSGPTDDDWPKWISSVEIGISGANNTSATNANCARFADNTEAALTCNFDQNGATAEQPCGTPQFQFRVSEYDCTQGGSTSDGNGGPSDGVYIRTTFSRDTTYLGSTENILVVLEYAAAAIRPTSSDPTQCFSGGVFDPSNTSCSDMSWQIYMKHAATDIVQPYLLLVPPAFGHADTTNNRGGSGVATKQFILPLAADSAVSVLQISRIKAMPHAAPLSQICKSKTAGCLGMTFHSMTFYRM